jgi:hypothetical protein
VEAQNLDTFTLDVTGGNGTPFRFVYWPSDGTVRYYDRRYTLTEGEPGYGLNQTNENGQSCGPRFHADDFSPSAGHGIRGWHGVDEWDIDRPTRRLVGYWIQCLKEVTGHAHPAP